MRDELTPVIDTRLRFLRRLIDALDRRRRAAAGAVAVRRRSAASPPALLASGALFAAIIGFAARQTLANLIAGVMLTITQPLRIGDRVTIEDESGTVEDVRLNYTVVRGGDGGRIFVPNERLAAGILRNDTIVEPLVGLEVELWLPPRSTPTRRWPRSEGSTDTPIARVAEIAADGVRFTVARGTIAPAERPARESELRADALRALRGAGLLTQQDRPPPGRNTLLATLFSRPRRRRTAGTSPFSPVTRRERQRRHRRRHGRPLRRALIVIATLVILAATAGGIAFAGWVVERRPGHAGHPGPEAAPPGRGLDRLRGRRHAARLHRRPTRCAARSRAARSRS